MIDMVFSEMIHKLSGFNVLELQDIKEIWVTELKRNNVGTGIILACASMCDEIVAYKQQKQETV